MNHNLMDHTMTNAGDCRSVDGGICQVLAEDSPVTGVIWLWIITCQVIAGDPAGGRGNQLGYGQRPTGGRCNLSSYGS
ncbi:hypothetical protein L484_021628 [Morus notabilis]|uniref:Uncharacterized protein n=1 Tax=Morus notabilis TaxID=981085 RepID=W9RXT7_9ROSA|nr:hypothetical protein L484_021628 [Morus notabilis]